MCFFEGVNVYVGRGTDTPFQIIGAPWMNPALIIAEIPSHPLAGLRVDPVDFVPTMDPF